MKADMLFCTADGDNSKCEDYYGKGRGPFVYRDKKQAWTTTKVDAKNPKLIWITATRKLKAANDGKP